MGRWQLRWLPIPSFEAKDHSMDVMGFISDHMGHFSPYDVPNVLFMVFMGALLGYALARFGGRLSDRDARVLMLWSATAALAAAFVRAQLPLAVLFLALVLLVRMEPSTGRDRLLLFGALVLGMGCGSGAALIMFIAAIPYVALVRWAFPADKA